MDDRTYLAAVDLTDPTLVLADLKQLIQEDDRIVGWWNHIPGTYLLRSSLDASALSDLLRTATHEANLLVMEVNPQVSDGWLPDRSWNWIKQRTAELSLGR